MCPPEISFNLFPMSRRQDFGFYNRDAEGAEFMDGPRRTLKNSEIT